jgi:hypothetical protein
MRRKASAIFLHQGIMLKDTQATAQAIPTTNPPRRPAPFAADRRLGAGTTPASIEEAR